MKLLERIRRKLWTRQPADEVGDEEVIRNILALPRHHSGNDVLYELSNAPWMVRGNMPTGNFATNFWGIHKVVIAAGVAETTTLIDPLVPGLLIVLTAVTVGSAGTRTVTYSAGYDSVGDTTFQFTATRQTAAFFSVPDKTASGTTSGYRWELVAGDVAGINTVFNNLTLTGLLYELAGNNITAAGTTQATGTQLAAQVNTIGTAAAGTGVNLPAAAAAGLMVVVANNGANPLKVYPFIGSTDTINGNAATVGVLLYPGSIGTFSATAAGAWTAQGDAASSAAYNTAANTTAFTLTGAQIAGGTATVDLTLTGTLGSGQALTLPTVAATLAALQTVAVGTSIRLRIINLSSGAFAWTVTTNAGSGTWTLTGTMTIAQNTAREFVLTVTSVTAGSLTATLQSLGQITVAA